MELFWRVLSRRRWNIYRAECQKTIDVINQGCTAKNAEITGE